MKYIDFNKLKTDPERKKDKRILENPDSQFAEGNLGIVIPFHAMLKNELKLYRGASTSARLGVLRKYDELIAMAQKK